MNIEKHFYHISDIIITFAHHILNDNKNNGQES